MTGTQSRWRANGTSLAGATFNMSRSLVSGLLLLLLSATVEAAHIRDQGPVILCYHIVEAPKNSSHAISRQAFVQQMSYLAENGYRVMSLSELGDYVSGRIAGPMPPNSVVVTVDDGWRSTLTEVLPVMQRFNFPFTAFIYPRFIGGGGVSLSWNDVRTLIKGGADIQSHTFSHPFLTRRRQRSRSSGEYAKWLHHELVDSRAAIERETGKKVRFLAYPYGDYDASVERAAAAAGYRAALTCNEGPITAAADAFKLRRFAIDRTTTLDLFKRYIAQSGAPRVRHHPQTLQAGATVKPAAARTAPASRAVPVSGSAVEVIASKPGHTSRRAPRAGTRTFGPVTLARREPEVQVEAADPSS